MVHYADSGNTGGYLMRHKELEIKVPKDMDIVGQAQRKMTLEDFVYEIIQEAVDTWEISGDIELREESVRVPKGLLDDLEEVAVNNPLWEHESPDTTKNNLSDEDIENIITMSLISIYTEANKPGRRG
jgi:hypothetical protein